MSTEGGDMTRGERLVGSLVRVIASERFPVDYNGNIERSRGPVPFDLSEALPFTWPSHCLAGTRGPNIVINVPAQNSEYCQLLFRWSQLVHSS